MGSARGCPGSTCKRPFVAGKVSNTVSHPGWARNMRACSGARALLLHSPNGLLDIPEGLASAPRPQQSLLGESSTLLTGVLVQQPSV